MIKQNLHTHCKWDDGMNTVEEMIVAARKAGLTSLGVSVHTPVPYSSATCPESELYAYLNEMKSLKEQYAKEGFQLFAGIEWDVLSTIPDDDTEKNGRIIPGFFSFDYVIGSVHAIPVKRSENPANPTVSKLLRMMGDRGYDYPVVDEDIKKTKYMVRDLFGGDGDAAAEQYFAQYREIAENPFVNIVGHFDLLKKFCHLYPYYDDKEYHVFNENSGRYRDAAIAALDLLIKEEKIFELNTRQLYVYSDSKTPSYTQYPSVQWLEYIRDHGGRVTVSSDAHRAEDVADHFRTAEAILKEVGFSEIWVLEAASEGNLFLPHAME